MIENDDELTTERGCFNCVRFKNCRLIESEKRKSRDFMEIFTDLEEDYRFGCSCDSYLTKPEKEHVQFT